MEKVATQDDKVQVAKAQSSYKRTRSAGDGTITQRPDGRYRAYLRWTDASGNSVNKTKVCDKFRTAQKALTEFKIFRDSGQDPKAGSKTVGGLLDNWLRFKASEVSTATIEQYRYSAIHLKQGLGNVNLSKLQPEMIDKFLRSKLESGLSPRYTKLLRTVLSMSLDQAIRWRLISSNPARFSASIKQPQNKGRSLTELQAKALLESSKDDRLGALWIVLLSLGLRRGEALALTWQDYDRKAQTLSITKNRKKQGSKVVIGELKTESSRRVLPLPNFVADTLDSHKANQVKEKQYLLSLGMSWENPEAMFSTVSGHYLDPDNASKLFKSVAKKAGLSDWHIHELRHSAASLMLAQGVNLVEVSKLIGHSSIRITADTYGHLQADRLRQATEVLGGYLCELTK